MFGHCHNRINFNDLFLYPQIHQRFYGDATSPGNLANLTGKRTLQSAISDFGLNIHLKFRRFGSISKLGYIMGVPKLSHLSIRSRL